MRDAYAFSLAALLFAMPAVSAHAEMTGVVSLDAVNPDGRPMHSDMKVDSKWVKDSCK